MNFFNKTKKDGTNLLLLLLVHMCVLRRVKEKSIKRKAIHKEISRNSKKSKTFFKIS